MTNDLRPSTRLPRWLRNATLLAGILVCLNIAWRTVRYALNFPMWGDEAFVAMNFFGRDFADLVKPLEYQMIVPLGFLWAELAVVKVAGLSELAMHLLPYVTGVVSMLLFWRLARSMLSRRAALLAIAVFAASYYPVRHAAEVKPYAGDLLVSLILLAFAWQVRNHSRCPGRWVLLIVFGAMGVWLSYPAVFVVGAVGLMLVMMVIRGDAQGAAPLEPGNPPPACAGGSLKGVSARSRSQLAENLAPLRSRPVIWTAVYSVVVLASFAAMYVVFARPHAMAATSYFSEESQWGEAWPPMSRPWLLPWWLLSIHAGNMMSYPMGGKNFGSIATLLLVIIGSWRLWRSGRVDLLLLLLGALPLMFLAAALQKYPYGTSARVSLHLAGPICLLMGVGLNWAIHRIVRGWLKRSLVARRRVVVAALCVFAGLATAGLVADVVQPYKKLADLKCKQAVADLAGKTGSADRWVVFQSIGPTSDSDDLRKLGGSAARWRYYVSRYSPVPVTWGSAPSEIAVPPGGRLHFIVYKDNYKEGKVFPQATFDKYFVEMTAKLGVPPVAKPTNVYPFEMVKGQPEAMEVYTFTAPASPG